MFLDLDVRSELLHNSIACYFYKIEHRFIDIIERIADKVLL